MHTQISIPPYLLSIPIIFILIVVILIIPNIWNHIKINKYRSAGLYPQQNKETERDIENLIRLGEDVLAIKCYRALHSSTLKDAKKHIELLKKNIQS